MAEPPASLILSKGNYLFSLIIYFYPTSALPPSLHPLFLFLCVQAVALKRHKFGRSVARSARSTAFSCYSKNMNIKEHKPPPLDVFLLLLLLLSPLPMATTLSPTSIALEFLSLLCFCFCFVSIFSPLWSAWETYENIYITVDRRKKHRNPHFMTLLRPLDSDLSNIAALKNNRDQKKKHKLSTLT